MSMTSGVQAIYMPSSLGLFQATRPKCQHLLEPHHLISALSSNPLQPTSVGPNMGVSENRGP